MAYLKSLEGEGVFYLEEGTHEFTLKDGRRGTLYASPYTPAFKDFAFAYEADEDRFNKGLQPIPEGVDIVMSHGPPAFPGVAGYKLDVASNGSRCGCEKLAKAVRRKRPRLRCFGHIYEGRGVVKMGWLGERLERVEVVQESEIEAVKMRKENTGESILLNAAFFGDGKGWAVDINLTKV